MSAPPLELWTSRKWLLDPDLLDITLATGGRRGRPFAPSPALLGAAKRGELGPWVYELRFMAEMERSQDRHVEAWVAALARPRLVIGCYEVDPEQCHRSIVARILVARGAIYRGEIPLPSSVAETRHDQLDLFGGRP